MLILHSAVNNSTPTYSQTLAHPIDSTTNAGQGTASAPVLNSVSSTAPAVEHPSAAKDAGTVPTNDTTSGSGKTGFLTAQTGCGSVKRSWVFRGRVAAYLHVRECVAPIALEPATGLLPNPGTSSESESKSQAASSPEPQAAKVSPQTDSQSATKSPQADSQSAKNTQQTESQSANVAPQVDSQSASPAVVPAPTYSPVIVQGQTVPANGNPITINNQLVRVSSGSIHVGSSAAPVPQAQAVQSDTQPLVAGTLTFHPASPSPVLQAAPSPVVVGGLTFSAPPSEPSSGSQTTPDQPQAHEVVVGGKTYAPPAPTSQSEAGQAAGSTPEQGDSKPPTSQEQSNSAAIKPDQPSPQLAQADFKPIVIGGMTYTPVTANPTSTPQSAGVYSIDGTTLTQGGKAVTVSGTRLSLGFSGVEVGTSSIPFSTTAPPTSLLAIGSQTLTALPGREGSFEIDHSTLHPGSPAVVISGTTYSINAADSLIIGTSTIALATAGSNNSALTAGGETFTPLGSTAVAVDGTTLSIGGPAMTENGTRLSLATNGFLVGSSTFAYATPVANTATVSTAGGTFSTNTLPSGGAIATTFPSATGGVGKSAASATTSTPTVMTLWFGVSMSLCVTIGIL